MDNKELLVAKLLAPNAYWGDPGTNHEQIEALAKAAQIVRLFDTPELTWKPIESAPKTKTLFQCVFILAYVPELAQPNNRDAGVCVVWWEPEQEAWFSEAGDENIHPTEWLLEIKAPSPIRR